MLKVKTWGTRGSIPISNKNSIEYGGNTTCLEIISDCLPKDTFLIVDAGSGIVPIANEINKYAMINKIKVKVIILFTHYHHDHTQGLLLSPILFNKNFVDITLVGPEDKGIGPKNMIETLMKPPFFPIDYRQVASHINYKTLDIPARHIILFHKFGGMKVMLIDEYENITNKNSHIPIGKGKYPVDEILVVKMYKTTHPEQTISYRFDDNLAGKSMVFLTDHENTDGIPMALKFHLLNADLAIMDSQYDRLTYERITAGFGHSTPDYCARLAIETGVKKLGLTHHDPNASDVKVEEILEDAKKSLKDTEILVFACKDYMEINV